MKQIKDLDLKEKKYIIFDMDGTLIDSIGVWNETDQKLIKEFGNLDLDLDTIQINRDRFFETNFESDSYLAYCDYLIKKYGFKFESAAELLKIRGIKCRQVFEEEMEFKPGVVELIYLLKRLGFTLILATMTTKEQLDIYSKKNKKMFTKMDIEEAFDFIVKKEDVQNKKPHPEIYNKIMEHYKAEPQECLIFEDSFAGVLASKKAGIEVVVIYDKYADNDREKINAIADYSIDDYGQFIEFLDNSYSKVKN